jgi:hypothetical protein
MSVDVVDVLEACLDYVHIRDVTRKHDKPRIIYDQAKAIARWETDGGAPREGRPSKSTALEQNLLACGFVNKRRRKRQKRRG